MTSRAGDRHAGALVSCQSTSVSGSGLGGQSPTDRDTAGHLLPLYGPGLSPPPLHLANQESLVQDAPPAGGSRSLELWRQERFESSAQAIRRTRRRSRARAAQPTWLLRSPAPGPPARVGAKDTSGHSALSERLRPRNQSCWLRGSLATLFLSVTPPLRSPVNARRDHASN